MVAADTIDRAAARSVLRRRVEILRQLTEDVRHAGGVRAGAQQERRTSLDKSRSPRPDTGSPRTEQDTAEKQGDQICVGRGPGRACMAGKRWSATHSVDALRASPLHAVPAVPLGQPGNGGIEDAIRRSDWPSQYLPSCACRLSRPWIAPAAMLFGPWIAPARPGMKSVLLHTDSDSVVSAL